MHDPELSTLSPLFLSADCCGEVLFPVRFLPLDILCLPRHQRRAALRFTQHHWGGEERWLRPFWPHSAARSVLPPIYSKGNNINVPLKCICSFKYTMQLVFHVKNLILLGRNWIYNVSIQCHGLWDNKEVEMPDFFKKLKKKVDKKKMTGDKMGSKERAPRRLRFLPLQASTTSIFCRRKRGDSAETDGEYIQIWSHSVQRFFFFFLTLIT